MLICPLIGMYDVLTVYHEIYWQIFRNVVLKACTKAKKKNVLFGITF